MGRSGERPSERSIDRSSNDMVEMSKMAMVILVHVSLWSHEVLLIATDISLNKRLILGLNEIIFTGNT